MDDRLPPQNMEAEQAVLGCLMIEGQAVERARAILSGECFYRDAHRAIWDAAIALHDRAQEGTLAGTPIDLLTMQAELTRSGRFEEVGGFLYLQTLMETPTSAENVDYYAQLVHEKFLLRRLLDATVRMQGLVYQSEQTAQEVVEEAEVLVSQIAQSRSTSTLVPLQPIIAERIAELHKRVERRGATGQVTPFDDYNYMTGGLRADELTVIAARPSMGKTSAVLQIALHHAATHGRVCFFSLEMSKDQIVDRILFSEAKVDSASARSGYLRQDQVADVEAVERRLADIGFFIDDTPSVSIMELRSKARRMHATGGVSLICVDYLQLVAGVKRGTNRTEEMGEVARGLKALARELQVPVIALAQLSRAVENRPDKRPLLSDLRESGNIEAEADVVTFIYRPSYYKREEETGEVDPCEWIIGKQRNGPTGVMQLGWVGRFTRFENLEAKRSEEAGYSPYAEDEDDPYDDGTNPHGKKWTGA